VVRSVFRSHLPAVWVVRSRSWALRRLDAWLFPFDGSRTVRSPGIPIESYPSGFGSPCCRPMGLPSRDHDWCHNGGRRAINSMESHARRAAHLPSRIFFPKIPPEARSVLRSRVPIGSNSPFGFRVFVFLVSRTDRLRPGSAVGVREVRTARGLRPSCLGSKGQLRLATSRGCSRCQSAFCSFPYPLVQNANRLGSE